MHALECSFLSVYRRAKRAIHAKVIEDKMNSLIKHLIYNCALNKHILMIIKSCVNCTNKKKLEWYLLKVFVD